MPFFQKPISQKSIAVILIMAISFLVVSPILLLPRSANAIGCPVYEAGSLPEEKQTAIQTGWRAVTKSYESGSLSAALTTAAEQVWTNAQKIVTWMRNVLLNLLLHQILAMLTNDIVNWIQNGGEPRFMSMSLDDYLEDAADNAIGSFIDQYLGAGWLCEPFDLDIKLAILDVPTFQEEVRCSLSDIVSNINDFYDDFSQGGWKGWIELSKPANNFYGATLLAQAEKMAVEEIAKKELAEDMEMGQGYLSPKDCNWYDANSNLVEEQKDVWGTPPLPAACQIMQPIDPHNPGATVGGFQGPCYKKCKILTPASSVNKMANTAITNFYQQINSGIASIDAGPYSVYVQAIASALINKVITEGIGLLKAEDEEGPDFGDIGASEDIPEIASPEQAMQDQVDAELLSDQFELLEDYANDFLDEQETNLAVLKLIPSTYLTTISALDNVITGYCSTTPAYVVWATNEKNHIQDNIIPSYNALINQVENTEIPDTLSLISDIASAISLVEDFNAKTDDWLTVWEDTAGDPADPDLQAADDTMNNAKISAIESAQEILKTINGIYSSDDFNGFNSEIITAITNLVTEILELEEDRGNANWPEAGTLYGELDAAANLKDQAVAKSDECYQNWLAQQIAF